MSKHWLAALALVTVLGLFTPALIADNDKSPGKGNKHAANSYQNSEQGWEERDGYQYRSYSNPKERPPGWNRGKKTGWNYCGTPPGQGKKSGCRTYDYQGRPHYYYQDNHGVIIVRRPTVVIQGAVVVTH
jgi:hypothetical protein